MPKPLPLPTDFDLTNAIIARISVPIPNKPALDSVPDNNNNNEPTKETIENTFTPFDSFLSSS